MKIEELLKEVKIRFGEDWETCELMTKIAPEWKINTGNDCVKLTPNEIWNENGLLYFETMYQNWATAKLTEAPEKWVVGKDINHPLWGYFEEYTSNIIEKGLRLNLSILDSYKYFGRTTYDADNLRYDTSLLPTFEGYQYLTLEQWYELIYKPNESEVKVGDWAILYNDIDSPKESYIENGRVFLRRVSAVTSVRKITKYNNHGTPFDHAYKINLNEPLQPQIDNFLSLNVKNENI